MQNAEQTVLDEDGRSVLRLLETLPPAQREVLALAVDGFTPTEIAELLGKTRAAVRKNLQFARERLKHELAFRSAEQEQKNDPV